MQHLLFAAPRWAWLFGLLLCLGLARPAWAQLPSTAVVDPDLTRPQTDTARVAPKLTKKQKREQAAADSALKTERLFGLRLTRPQKALLLAGIAPGAGQIYNKKYWKLPLVYGLLGTLGGVEYFFQTHYTDYRYAKEQVATGKVSASQLANARTEPIEDWDSAKNANSTTIIESGIIFYRRNRDLYILLLIGGHGLQMLDALVDANLHDFDVGKDLTLHWQPALLPVPGQLVPGVGATVALRVK
ncbi:DUF5683 domain-containing protein [Hymenobacter bucti]|uniref:DUF5683 domain-containing protein n=1 Tax=Hymenobacter bucti TaxID=1844114 RepID=A0ABW4QPD9_9BACT